MSCTATRFLHCVNNPSPVVACLAPLYNVFCCCFCFIRSYRHSCGTHYLHVSDESPYICLIYLFHSIFILNLARLYMTWEPCVGNEFLTQPRGANIQVTATLTLADTSSCSTEKCLLVSVRVYERQHTGQTMNQMVIAFQSAGNNKRQRGRASL